MKAIFKPTPQLAFEITGEDAKTLFAGISDVQEVFAAESKCGMCSSQNIGYSHRRIEDFDYYELRCQDCRADFKFGQAKKGGRLFPKRKDEDGRLLPNGGWSRYEPGSQSDAPAQKPVPVQQKVAATVSRPEYSDWHEAQNDKRYWGTERVLVAGKPYRLNQDTGQYQLEAEGSAKR